MEQAVKFKKDFETRDTRRQMVDLSTFNSVNFDRWADKYEIIKWEAKIEDCGGGGFGALSEYINAPWMSINETKSTPY